MYYQKRMRVWVGAIIIGAFIICGIAAAMPDKAHAQMTVVQGGTGTTTVPKNYVLVGKDSLHLTAIATSSLGLVSSVSNSDGTLTISPTIGAVIASINLTHANIWTALQTFSNASTSLFTVSGAQWITPLGTPAGAILAVDPTGKIIATTTSAGGVTSVTGVYPIISSGGGTPAISIAFGTTTANTWALLQTFTSGLISQASSSFSGFTSLQNASTTQLTAPIIWTGLSAYNLLATDANGKMVATSTINTGFLVGNLGTINTTAPLGGGGAFDKGTTLTLTCATCLTSQFPTSTNPLMATYFVATTTTATSTFGGFVNVTGTNSTSTFSGNVRVVGNLQVDGNFFAPVSLTAGGDLNMATHNITNVGGLTGTFITAIANGGTNASSQTTNGINYFDGTKITSGTALFWNASAMGVGTNNPTGVNANAKLTVAGIGNQDIIASTTDITTSSNAILEAYSDSNRTLMGAHGSISSGTRYGLSLAGWGEISLFQPYSTVPNGLVIGTQPNAPLVFGTQNLERMRILGTGNVGIGTTTPDSTLTIADYGTFGMPYATTTVSLTTIGQTKLNVVAASTSIAFRGSGATLSIPTAMPRSAIIASSTLAYMSTTFGATGSTTLDLINNPYPSTLKRIYCKTTVGNVQLQIGNGSATTTLSCGTAGTDSGVITTTFANFANIVAILGSTANAFDRVTITTLLQSDVN